MIKTGLQIIDVDSVVGSGVDKVVCVYGRTGVIPGETISVVVGWMDGKGNFQNLAQGSDSVNRKNLDPKDQLAFFKSLSDGSVLTWHLHTFSGITDVDQIKPGKSNMFPNQHEFVQKLLLALDNQLLDRLSGIKQKPEEYWAHMNAEEGDLGFIPAGGFDYVRLVPLR